MYDGENFPLKWVREYNAITQIEQIHILLGYFTYLIVV